MARILLLEAIVCGFGVSVAWAGSAVLWRCTRLRSATSSAIDWYRSAGSAARALSTKRLSSVGSSGRPAARGGAPSSMAVSSSRTFAPRKGLLRASIS